MTEIIKKTEKMPKTAKTPQINDLQTCINIIKKAFADKKDKAGQPYISHLYRVRDTIERYFMDYELSLIALLHDILEDCPEWTPQKLSQFFSGRVVNAVKTLTKAKNEDYSDYLARISQNPDAVKVKLADLQDNMDVFRLNIRNTEEDYLRLLKYQDATRYLSVFLNKKQENPSKT